MLVVMKNDATKEQVQAVIEEIERMGFRGIPMPGAERTAVCIVGNKGPVDDIRLLTMDGVKEAIPVTKPFKLVSKETKPESTVIIIGSKLIQLMETDDAAMTAIQTFIRNTRKALDNIE